MRKFGQWDPGDLKRLSSSIDHNRFIIAADTKTTHEAVDLSHDLLLPPGCSVVPPVGKGHAAHPAAGRHHDVHVGVAERWTGIVVVSEAADHNAALAALVLSAKVIPQPHLRRPLAAGQHQTEISG
jgi:hypothetical protein